MIFLLRLVVSLGSLCLTQAACTKDGCPFSAVSGFIGPDYKYTRCGQVDAAPRMPNDIWKDPHAVELYVNYTIKLWAWSQGSPPALYPLRQEACADHTETLPTGKQLGPYPNGPS